MFSIVFVVPEMLPVPPTEGGAVEHWVHEVSRRMAGMPVDVAVVSRPASASGMTEVPDDVYRIGVPWTSLGQWWRQLKQRSGRRNPLRGLAKLASVLGYAGGVRWALRHEHADVVYVHNDPVLALLIGKHDGQKLVLHMHNDHLGMAVLRPLVALLLRRTALVLCVSDFIRDRARQAFPGHAHKIHTVLNATDPELFARQPTMGPQASGPAEPVVPSLFHFLFVGRLTEDKGVHVLIDAFTRVHQAHPHTRLVIVGSSFFANAPRTPYQERLVAQAAAVSGAIVFTGFLPHEQLRAVYAHADAVVVPSIWQEPFGLVGLEAMSSQSCVIASRVGGLPELIAHERTGLLVPPNDVPALCEAMERVVLDSGLRTRLALAARVEVLRRFAYPRLVKEVADRIGALV